MKTPARTALAVAIATVVLGPAFGQQQRAHDEMSGPDTKGSVEAEMSKMDSNQDGKISAAEHEAGTKQMFQSMDANRDNRVTAAEMNVTQKPLQGHEAGHGHQKGDSHHISAVDQIKAVDTNGDGVMSAEECAAGAKKMFKKMDANNDGFLTATEIKAGHDTQMSVDRASKS